MYPLRVTRDALRRKADLIMIIVMKKDATEKHIEDVVKTVEVKGFKSHLSKGSRGYNHRSYR